jgi:DNA-binding transcriptional ArsR family regulator
MNIPQLDHFQVVADPSRREMLYLLSKNSLSINSLAGNFEMSRPAVSKHIKILHTAGFISIEEKGRERFCILKQEGFKELQEWLNYYNKFWNDKVNNLKQLLNKTSKKKK